MKTYAALVLCTCIGVGASDQLGPSGTGSHVSDVSFLQHGLEVQQAEAGHNVRDMYDTEISPSSADASSIQSAPLSSTLDVAQRPHVLPAAEITKAQLLVLIVSCHHNTKHWPDLRVWGESVHPNGLVLILAGAPPNSSMPNHYQLSLKDHTLFVNGNDGYDGLPEKMLLAYSSVLLAPELENITHVLKVDDTSVRESEGKWHDSNLSLVTEVLGSRPTDYIGPEFGLLVPNCTKSEHKPLNWHMDGHANLIPLTSPWFETAYDCQDSFPYFNGGSGYILSRYAIGILAEAWPRQSMKVFSRTHIFEDYAVGLTLYRGGVKAIPVSIPGMPEWDRQSCECTPPCLENSPNVLKQIYRDECYDMDDCCFAVCKETPGLCSRKYFLGTSD